MNNLLFSQICTYSCRCFCAKISSHQRLFCYWKWDLAAHRSKANAQEAGLVGRKVCVILEACSWRVGRLLLKGQLPTDSQWEELSRGPSGCAGWGRGYTQNSIFGCEGRLAVGHRWSDQHLLGCFKHSQSSVPGPFVFHFFESSSWDRGSLGHGCGGVIMQLASPSWGVSVSKKQLTGLGSEYYQSPWGGTKGP